MCERAALTNFFPCVRQVSGIYRQLGCTFVRPVMEQNPQVGLRILGRCSLGSHFLACMRDVGRVMPGVAVADMRRREGTIAGTKASAQARLAHYSK